MAYNATVVADSLSPGGKRLTTMEVTFPRMVLAEFNTHRMLSRNSASSRAIPVSKQIRKLLDEPFIPERFGVNQPGMQSYDWLKDEKHKKAVQGWLRGRDRAASTAFELLIGDKMAGEIFGYLPGKEHANLEMLLAGFDDAIEYFDDALKAVDTADTDIDEGFLNVHKQICNRVLEPYMWHTVLVTATEWSNFYALRDDKEAQAEIRTPAHLMKEAVSNSTPVELNYEEWHTPLIQPDENFEVEVRIQVSCGRCARISYLTHFGKRDHKEDIKLYKGLVNNGHMSPTEHVAKPAVSSSTRKGNFIGWHQHRADLPHEDDFGEIKKLRAA